LAVATAAPARVMENARRAVASVLRSIVSSFPETAKPDRRPDGATSNNVESSTVFPPR
jgi:hypothetical protein